MFELPSKDGDITPEKARKPQQMQFRDKTAYVIDEPRSPARALYATLDQTTSDLLVYNVKLLTNTTIFTLHLLR